jgi:actin
MISCLNLSGRNLTAWMMKLITERCYESSTTAEKEIARDIKERFSHVDFDFEAKMKKTTSSSDVDRSYELPDGNVITIGSERFRFHKCCSNYILME